MYLCVLCCINLPIVHSIFQCVEYVDLFRKYSCSSKEELLQILRGFIVVNDTDMKT